jgi:hypothetical protein
MLLRSRSHFYAAPHLLARSTNVKLSCRLRRRKPNVTPNTNVDNTISPLSILAPYCDEVTNLVHTGSTRWCCTRIAISMPPRAACNTLDFNNLRGDSTVAATAPRRESELSAGIAVLSITAGSVLRPHHHRYNALAGPARRCSCFPLPTPVPEGYLRPWSTH